MRKKENKFIKILYMLLYCFITFYVYQVVCYKGFSVNKYL